ncbi:MAG: efflux RND transporter periplasmic adaptor subunit [FCB group bacterium]|nr:efflux RND transporter periplasmic adaptor subunit [FCB group bacterium]
MEQNNNSELSSLKIDRNKKNIDRPRSKKWYLIIWIIILVGIVITFFAVKEKVTPATKVKTSTVTYLVGSESYASLVASGYVVAQRKAEVASKGTGRLKHIYFEEGDTVATGEVIAELENDDIKAKLDIQKANLLKAQADSLNAFRNYERQKKLYASGSITEAQWENAETSYQLALASVAAAKASVREAEVDLENTFIRAPFSGTILSKNADVGEVVAPFASSSTSKGSVVTLADMNSLEIEADVSESNIYKVFVGQKCDIILDAYPHRIYPGQVKKIVPTADRTRATVLTKVAFLKIDKRVLPEMSARINFFEDSLQIQNNEPNVIAVDKDALTSRNNKKVVFRINKNRVEEVPVKTGRELGDKVEIKNGLNVGDKVVLSPPGKMVSGQKIEITN